MIAKLISAGVNINLPSGRGEPPIYLAALNDDVEMLRFLIKNGANPQAEDERGYTPLMIASRLGNDKAVNFLLIQGIDPNSKNGISLILACLNNKYSTIKLLINSGANVNAKDKDDCTPLHYLAGDGTLEMVSYLVSKGADKNSLCRGNENPLKWAKYGKNTAVVEYLSY